jgi:E3 ubiquitin-protein ligase listerin
LRQYLQKGSQGAAESYWSNLVALLSVIPPEIIGSYPSKTNETSQTGSPQAKALMNDLLDALTSRDEPRYNLKTGWAAYYGIGLWLSTLIPKEERNEFAEEFLTQNFDPYVNGQGDNRWTLPAFSAFETCKAAFLRLASHGFDIELKKAWENTTQTLLQAVKMSLPEQSKDFKSSQEDVCAKANRYFKLQATILSNSSSENNSTTALFRETTLLLLEGSLQVLQARNGKPYGAAAIVEEAIRHVPQLVITTDPVINDLKTVIPQLLSSPSADRIMSVILMCSDWEGFDSVFDASLQQMTEAKSDGSSGSALQKLLSTVDFQKVHDSSHFVSIVSASVGKAIRGNASEWPIVFSVAENKTVPDGIVDEIVTALFNGLSSDEDSIIATLSGLSNSGGQKPSALRRLRKGRDGSRLVARLLYLTESPIEEISQNSAQLEKKMRETVSADITFASSREIVGQGLKDVGPQSLS